MTDMYYPDPFGLDTDDVEALPEPWQPPEGGLDYLADGKSWLVATTDSTDSHIVRVARNSHATAAVRSDDESLARFLMRHRHDTPREFGRIEVHTTLPVFLARQLVRHRTAALSEVSARYCAMPSLVYIPSLDRFRTQSKSNKQMSGERLPLEVARNMRQLHIASATFALTYYNSQLLHGVARETARMVLPQSMYTMWWWTANLRNVMHLLSLRDKPNAQWEAQQWAKALSTFIKDQYPVHWQAYEDYVAAAITLTGPEVMVMAVVLGQGMPQNAAEWQGVFALVSFPGQPGDRERKECVAKIQAIRRRLDT